MTQRNALIVIILGAVCILAAGAWAFRSGSRPAKPATFPAPVTAADRLAIEQSGVQFDASWVLLASRREDLQDERQYILRSTGPTAKLTVPGKQARPLHQVEFASSVDAVWETVPGPAPTPIVSGWEVKSKDSRRAIWIKSVTDGSGTQYVLVRNSRGTR